mmetsp:Transcript_12510/g.23453  ORF Transcript_12510/g.23453 Transcript_12510/m.23453 type:complete len:97 (-) Transcript_12510:497-787(-)
MYARSPAHSPSKKAPFPFEEWPPPFFGCFPELSWLWDFRVSAAESAPGELCRGCFRGLNPGESGLLRLPGSVPLTGADESARSFSPLKARDTCQQS